MDLYREFFNTNENIIISPISFRILLSLVYQSALPNSTAEEQLLQVLHLPLDREEAYQSQVQSINVFRGTPHLKVVNKVYLKVGETLLNEFQNNVERYSAGIEQVSFSEKKETADKINSWVESQTNGLIKDLVSEQSISEDTALFLLNTIYFKAKWRYPFNEERKNEVFYSANGEISTPFMLVESVRFGYASVPSLKSEILEMLYEQGSNYKFWLILPNSDSSIDEVKNLLNSESIDAIKSTIKSTKIDVTMPSFQSESVVDGKKYLTKMGLESVFKLAELDMVTGDHLRIDDAVQKVKIIVNTDGTEAAVGTCVF